MAKKTIHVSAHGDGKWQVTKGGMQVSSYRTQKDAINAGRREAQRSGVELVTHGRDGKIRSKDSYVVAYRVIKESAGTPSVSRSKIATAAKDVFRDDQGWTLRPRGASKNRIG